MMIETIINRMSPSDLSQKSFFFYTHLECILKTKMLEHVLRSKSPC